MKNHPKIDAEVAGGHLFFDFMRFGEWPKKQEIFDASPVTQKSGKSVQKSARDLFLAEAGGQGYVAWRPGSMGRPRARDSHKLKE